MSYIVDKKYAKNYSKFSHIYMSFCREGTMNRIKEYRKQQGLSQAELAKRVEVARQTINLIENTTYNPSLELCIKIAKELQTDLNTLFWNLEGEE